MTRLTLGIIRLRRFLSKILNRNFLVFIFFLAMSAAFWLFLALNDEYERDFAVSVRLRGVPENVVITTGLPSSFHVVLKDRGSQLLHYRYAGLPVLTFDFKNYDQQSGHVVLSLADVTKVLIQKLPVTTKLVSYKPDKLEYYFNNGLNVRLPVQLRASLRPEHYYGISSVRVIPDSVTVYATQDILDTLSSATTVPIYLSNISENQVRRIDLSKIRGVKFEPASVKLKINVDQMTEKTVLAPVKWVNFPASKTLRTFPSKVKIIFQVGMSMYRKITADDFTIVVNYADLLKETDGNVHLSLKSIPFGVSHVRIVPSDVDFLIEDNVEEEN